MPTLHEASARRTDQLFKKHTLLEHLDEMLETLE